MTVAWVIGASGDIQHRPERTWIYAMLTPLMLCALLAAAPAEETPAPTKAEEFELIAIEKLMVEQTNAQRARYGLAPLKVDVKLMKSSRQHGIWMARNRSLQHSRGVAENIAMGYTSTPDVMRGWMNSSGHRANILNRSYRSLGVAAYQSAGGTIYWCQQFRSSPPAEPLSDSLTAAVPHKPVAEQM